ncbi:MAG: type II toxin-antitoxin system VapC family toxin [Nitrososphaeria archaeon]|nr:type II toxin-antitoxin system VapC family toxin [Nitrososphaeria archaeon]
MKDIQEVVIDASVIVKWFVKEESSNKAIIIRDKYIDGEIKIIAPEILPFEALNARYNKKLFSKDELKEISEALEKFSFELYPLKGEYAKKIVEITVENNITVYGASYIALAILKNTQVYTSDRKLIERLNKEFLA